MIGDAGFWTDVGWTFLTSALTSAAVVGLIGIALKSALDRRTNAELERLKAELAADNARDLEWTRGAIQREGEQFKTRFTLLAQKQAEVYAGMYERLAVLFRNAQIYAQAAPPFRYGS